MFRHYGHSVSKHIPEGAQNYEAAIREVQRAEVTDTSLQKEEVGGLPTEGFEVM